MPGKVKVRILAGRNLPVMDRASDASDAFVEVKLGNTTFKTEVCRRSLNPQWNSEWFRFEVDDEELQDEPLQIRIMDYDTYSANDAIGKVYVDLNPLLSKETGPLMSGWFPIYDTMHGVRGEINVAVKVDLFSDSNKYRESSCGVKFFYSASIPHGYRGLAILGFVEELVVNDDPEYQWIDKIRTPRASNEARQTLFSKLSGEVQRKIGLKALELGGNAVIGYQQCFDLEGESGIVVRGIGTAITLVKTCENAHLLTSPQREVIRESPTIDDLPGPLSTGPSSPTGPAPTKLSSSPTKSGIPCGQRRSSDSDASGTPKGNSLGGSSGSGSGGARPSLHRPAVARDSLDMLEYPFLTMKQFPPSFIHHIGGVVSARSVKLLDHINNPDEPETRDAWWIELRKEIRSHTRSLGCNVLLGYGEATSICNEICILSASGTAAVLTAARDPDNITAGPVIVPRTSISGLTSGDKRDLERERDTTRDKEKPLKVDIGLANEMRQCHLSDWGEETSGSPACSLCHVPYSESSVPFPVHLVRCHVCRRSKVPDILFMTIEPPHNIPITGKGSLIQARVCRLKKDCRGEQNAKEISDSLPFLEYELHRQLLNKLKVKGMNGLFGLKVQVSVGEKVIVGVATGTAAFLTALPVPSIPKVLCGKSVDGSRSAGIQQTIHDMVTRNRKFYNIGSHFTTKTPDIHKNGKAGDDDSSSSSDDLPEVDLVSGNKNACVLQVDDAEDVDIIASLIDPCPPAGFELCNTESMPGVDSFVCNLQMFSKVFRTKLHFGSHTGKQVSQCLEKVIQSLFVKMRSLVPCCLANLNFHIDLPEQDEIQVSVLGVAEGLGDPNLLMTMGMHSCSKSKSGLQLGEVDHDMIFPMEEDKSPDVVPVHQSSIGMKGAGLHQYEPRFKYHSPYQENFGVDITPLGYIPGGKIERYLGNLDFFFIRESTSLREGGGLNGFIQSFITEVLAIVRAHVAALDGNGVVAFHMTQCILLYNPHKNQGQCLINVAGDAVAVSYLGLEQGESDLCSKMSCVALVEQ